MALRKGEKRVSDVMTSNLVCLPAASSVSEAAMAMRDAGIGDVMVEEGGKVCGIVTDRDITVRVVAEERSPQQVTLGQICSRELTMLSTSDPVEYAVKLMREKALRRLPVVEGGRPVGIVSIGDLALERDPKSALASISGAPANT